MLACQKSYDKLVLLNSKFLIFCFGCKAYKSVDFPLKDNNKLSSPFALVAKDVAAHTFMKKNIMESEEEKH